MGRRAPQGHKQNSLGLIESAVQMVVEQLEQRVFLSITAPTSLIASGTPTPGLAAAMQLDWQDNSSNESSFKIERKTGSGGTWGQIGTAEANVETYIDSTISGGTSYYYRLRASDGSEDSSYSNESDAIEWTSANVGTATGGSWSVDGNGVGTMVSNGAGMAGGSDNFRFAYRTLNGDGTIIARVTGVQYTNPMARAAVMFRNSLNANSRSAFLAIMPNGSAQWSYRRNDGDSAQQTSISNQAAPRWVKLVRAGSMITASVSSDGNTWTQVGQANISMNANVYVGLALSASEYSGGYNTSTFSNITVTRQDHSLPTGWTNQDIGTNSFAGSARYSNDGTYSFTVESSGQLVGWGSDNFHFAHEALTGDGEIIAHVAGMVGQDGGGYYPYALAGIMFRDGLASNARTALMAISGGDGARWQYRTTTGGNATENKVAGITVPYWVRLTRSGNTFTGYISSNGSSWTPVGSPITISGMPSSLEVGLMLNAAGYGSVNTSSFDHVSILAAPALTATAVHGRRVDLSWTSQAWGGVLRYVLERSEDNGSTWSQVGGDINAAGYIDSSAQPEKNYKYRVKAKNSDGGPWTSGWSALSDASTVGLGDGLSGTYWNNQDFTGTTATQVDEQISFQWSSGESPAAGIDGSTFAAEWKGRIKALATGTYTFTTFADDGVRVWVNDQLVIDRWDIQSPTTTSGTIDLTADQKYNLRIEYFQNFQSGDLTLNWTVPGTGVSVLVPTANLFSDTSQIPAAPAAPTNVTAYAPTSTKSFQAGVPDEPQVYVSWTAVSGAHRYNVYRTLDGGQTYEWVGTTDTTGISDKRSVVNGTNYQYRVVAIGAGGHSVPTEALLTPDVSLQVLSDSEVRLTWVDNNADEEGYRIDRSDDNGVTWETVGNVDANSTSYIDSGLEAGHSYLYRVSAANSMVVSAPEFTAAVVPSSVPASSVHATFFARPDLSGARYETSYPGIDFEVDWGSGSPQKGKIAKGPFSAIFDTTFVAPFTGNYQFKTKANGGVRLFVNSTKVYNRWADIPQLTTDFNNDGAVNFLDLSTMAGNYGASNKSFAQGDATGDGSVDFLDLSALAAIYGHSEGTIEQLSSTIALSAGQTYTLIAQYFNLYGQAKLTVTMKRPAADGGEPSVEVTLDNVPVTAASLPNPPSNLTTSGVTTAQVTLNWLDNSSNETGFRIERKGGASEQWADVAVVGTNATSYVDSNLRASTLYTYRVRAFNGSGASSATAEIPVTTTATSSPGTFTWSGSISQSHTDTTVFLSWAAPDPALEIGYFEVSRDGAVVATRTSTNFLDTGRSPETTYSYEVKAYTATGKASNANPISVTTSASVSTAAPVWNPGGLTPSYDAATRTLSLSWPSATGATKYDLSRDGAFVQTITSSGTSLTGMSPGQYNFSIAAADSVGNYSSTLSASITIGAVAASKLNFIPAQDIPQALQDHFYDDLTKALRERLELLPAVPTWPSAQHWFDFESVLFADPANPGSTSFSGLPYAPNIFYLDLDGNGHWSGRPTTGGQWVGREPVWIDNSLSGSADWGVYNASDSALYGATIPVGAVGSANAMLWHDQSLDGVAQLSEVYQINPRFIRGTSGDLAYFDINGDGKYSSLEPIWKESTTDGVFGVGDIVLYDPQSKLSAASLSRSVAAKQAGLQFYDANGDGVWTAASGTVPAEPIWHESTSLSLQPLRWGQAYQNLSQGAGIPEANITAFGNASYFKQDIWSFYQAIEDAAPGFRNPSGGIYDTWNTPALINEVTGGTPRTGTGQINATGSVTGVGTAFLSELHPGDWLRLADGRSYRVGSVISDTQFIVDSYQPTGGTENTGDQGFQIFGWTVTPSDPAHGLSEAYGGFKLDGLISGTTFDQLRTALSKLEQMPQMYGKAFYDSASSAALINAVNLLLNQSGPLHGYDATTGKLVDGTAEAIRMYVASGRADVGSRRDSAILEQIRGLEESIATSLKKRDGASAATNYWDTTEGFDINQWDIYPSYNWIEALPVPTWTTLGQKIEGAHLTERRQLIDDIQANGLWLASAGYGYDPITSNKVYQEVHEPEESTPLLPVTISHLDDLTPQTLPDPLDPGGASFDSDIDNEPNLMGVFEAHSMPSEGNPIWMTAPIGFTYGMTGQITLPSSARGTNLAPFVGMSFGPDAAVGPSSNKGNMGNIWGTQITFAQITAAQAWQAMRNATFVTNQGTKYSRDATTGLYLTTSQTEQRDENDEVISSSVYVNSDYHLSNALLGLINFSSNFAFTSAGTALPVSAVPERPSDTIVFTTTMDYRNAIGDTDRDDLIEVGDDLFTFGRDTGSITFQAERNVPQVYVPLFSNDYDVLPIHGYLVQGGFAASSGAPLLSDGLRSAFANEGGLPYAYSFNTRVRTNFYLDDGVNHVKRLEVVRPRGNAVVFDFAWDATQNRFKDTGLPAGWTARDAKRLYVLRQDASGYHLLFPSGIVHNFGTDGKLVSVSDMSGHVTSVASLPSPYVGLSSPNTTAGSDFGTSTARSDRYDAKLTWIEGHLERAQFTTKETNPAERHSITTWLGYGTPPAPADSNIIALDKKDDANSTIDEFSYEFDGALNTIENGEVTFNRTGSVATESTITRSTTSVPGSTSVRTAFNSDRLITEREFQLDRGGASGTSTAKTIYQYQTDNARYANGAPKWGKVSQITYPDGGWEKFAYRADTGWLEKLSTPFLDSLPADDLKYALFDYVEADGAPAGSANAARMWSLVERPRKTTQYINGNTAGLSFSKYVGTTTTTRAAKNSAGTWASADNYQTKTTIDGGSVMVETPTGSTSSSRSAIFRSESVTGPTGTTIRLLNNSYTPFGYLTSSSVTEQGASVGMTTSTLSSVGFGRIASTQNLLTGKSTTYNDYNWYGPQLVTGEDLTPTRSDYTSWGQVFKVTQNEVATQYDFDAAGNAIQTTVSSQTSPDYTLTAKARFDAQGRVVWSQDWSKNGSSGRETSTSYTSSGGALTVTTTLPDIQTLVNKYYVDGNLKSTEGTAAYPSAYTTGFDAAKGFFTQSSSNSGQNWSKTYFNLLGQAYLVEKSGPNGNIMTARTEFDALSRPKETRDFDDSIVLTQYDDKYGFVSDSILDLDQDHKYDGGTDRNTSYSRSFSTGGATMINGSSAPSHLLEVTTVHGGSTPATPDTSAVSRTGVNGLWSQQTGFGPLNEVLNGAYGLTTKSETTLGAGPGQATVKTRFADGTSEVQTFDKNLLQSVAQMATNGTTVVTSQSFGYDPLRRGTSSASSFGAGNLVTSWNINQDTGQTDSVTLAGGRTYQVYGRWSRDGTPTDIERPDGKIFRQEPNDYGQTSTLSGAGTFAQKFEYHSDTGQLETLTTYSSGDISGGGGAAVTTWNWNDSTGQFASKKYDNEATPSLSNAYKNNSHLDTSTSGGITGTAGQNTVGEANSMTLLGLETEVLVRDAKGRVLGTRQTATLPSGGASETYRPAVSYDANDRLASEQVGHVADTRVVYEYYAANDTAPTHSPGKRSAMKLMRGNTAVWQIDYLYDHATKRLSSIVAGGKTYTYDFKAGTDLVASLSSAGVVSSTLDYETSTGRWNKLEQKKTAGGQTLYSSNWTFNQGTAATDNNQKNHIDFSKASLETNPVITNYTWDYDYDENNADQLEWAQRKQVWSEGSSVLNTYNYTFDGIGNRTDKNFQTNSANQYQVNPDAGGNPITYDTRGNMTSDGVYTFTWNSAGQLTSGEPLNVVSLEQEADPDDGVDGPASRKVEFGYDDAGRRIWKKSYVYSSDAQAWLPAETRKFVYDGNNLAADFIVDQHGIDRLSRTYAWGKGIAGSVGGLLSITTWDDGNDEQISSPLATYIPLYDDRGNVVGLADATDGKLVAVYQYDPFGKLITESGDKAILDANPFLYSTHYFERELGIYNLRGGPYSPDLRRRMNREPMGEGASTNLSVWTGNDPINRVDPDGFDDQQLSGDRVDTFKASAYGYGAIAPSVARSMVSVPQPSVLSADGILFSQSNVKSTLPSLVDYMKTSGWGELPPIDVVRMPNGAMTAVDNTRLAAAKLTNTPVKAMIRGFGEAFPIVRDVDNTVFSNLATGERPGTWGEAVLNRIARQKPRWIARHPTGSPVTGIHPRSGADAPAFRPQIRPRAGAGAGNVAVYANGAMFLLTLACDVYGQYVEHQQDIKLARSRREATELERLRGVAVVEDMDRYLREVQPIKDLEYREKTYAYWKATYESAYSELMSLQADPFQKLTEAEIKRGLELMRNLDTYREQLRHAAAARHSSE